MEDSRSALNAEFTLVDLAIVVIDNVRFLVFVPICAALLALGITFVIPPTYTAKTIVLPPHQAQGVSSLLASQFGAFSGMGGLLTGIKNPVDMYVTMLQGHTIADGLIRRFGLKELYHVRFAQEAREELQLRTKIVAGRDGLISVSVEDENPQRAADIANAYVNELIALTQTLAVTEASQRRLFFEVQLKRSTDDLRNAELALRRAGISETTLNTSPAAALEFVAGLKARVTAQELKLAALRGFMTESNPELKQAQLELSALRGQLSKIEKNDDAKLGARGAEYVARFRDFKYHETLFELIAKQYEAARLDESREGALIQIVDLATPPELKSKPQRLLITILTGIAAFILLLSWLLLRRTLYYDAADPEINAKLTRIRQMLRMG